MELELIVSRVAGRNSLIFYCKVFNRNQCTFWFSAPKKHQNIVHSFIWFSLFSRTSAFRCSWIFWFTNSTQVLIFCLYYTCSTLREQLSSAGGRLVIASDGVWDALSAEMAVECCHGMPADASASQIVKVWLCTWYVMSLLGFASI